MPTDAKPPIIPTEAQRRRAALWWHLGSDEWPGSVYQWVKSGCVDDLLTHKQILPQAAQLIATIESEAEERGRARGVEEARMAHYASVCRERVHAALRYERTRLAAAERELAEERAPLSKEEWEQLFSLATGAPYPTKTPDACLIRGLQSWAENANGRVAMRRLLEEHRSTASKLAVAEEERDTARREWAKWQQECDDNARKLFDALQALAAHARAGCPAAAEDVAIITGAR